MNGSSMSRKNLHIFKTQEILSVFLAEKVLNLINNAFSERRNFYIAASGGKTPESLFRYIASEYNDPRQWDHVRFFWVDERCVSPGDPESNYRIVNDSLLRYLNLPYDNIFRIKGEEKPETEAARYSQLITDELPSSNGLPCFDLLMLGIGTDGHIASIFPDRIDLFYSDRLCEVAVHPQTGQRRITLTGKLINNAKHIFFLVTGKEKSVVISRILEKREKLIYPAGLVNPVEGLLEWFLDVEAARLLCK